VCVFFYIGFTVENIADRFSATTHHTTNKYQTGSLDALQKICLSKETTDYDEVKDCNHALKHMYDMT
jgi:hypothetical protein